MSFDIGLDKDGDLPIHPVHITGDDLILQRIRSRLLTFAGEWVLDDTVGMDFIRWRGTKPVPLVEIQGTTRQEIEAVPGVERVTTDEITLSNDGEVRYTASVQLASNTTVNLTFESRAPSTNAQPGIVVTRASVL